MTRPEGPGAAGLATWFGACDAISGYVQAYDDRDPEALRLVLDEDCRITVSAGSFRGQEFVGVDRIVDWLAGTWAVTPPCLHLTGNVRVMLHDDGIGATSDYLFITRSSEGGLRLVSSGRYVDRMVQVDGRWVIASRDVGPPQPVSS